MALVFSVAAIDRSYIPNSLGHRDLGRVASPQERCGGRSAVTEPTPEEGYKVLQSDSTQAVLGQEIRKILLPQNIPQIDSATSNGLLDPQGVGIQVPHLAQALP